MAKEMEAGFRISRLMGEQGVESIHAHLMKLERTHQGIPNELDRLKYIVKEHILESDPSLTCLRPQIRTQEHSSDNDSSSDTES